MTIFQLKKSDSGNDDTKRKLSRDIHKEEPRLHPPQPVDPENIFNDGTPSADRPDFDQRFWTYERIKFACLNIERGIYSQFSHALLHLAQIIRETDRMSLKRNDASLKILADLYREFVINNILTNENRAYISDDIEPEFKSDVDKHKPEANNNNDEKELEILNDPLNALLNQIFDDMQINK